MENNAQPYSADLSYQQLLSEIKGKIRTAQIRAMVSANREMLFLYWDIGKSILERQQQHGWGSKVVDQLGEDLRLEYPEMEGLSRRNLLYMRQFALAYPDFEFVQASLAQISWYHNITLLQKCKDEIKRFWYAAAALANGWSRDVLVHQIESKLYERQGGAPSNFQQTLPHPDSDMAQQTLKDPYIFDFLTLAKEAREKDLETLLMKHITRFLLELGSGFAFIGNQFPISVEDDTYKIDLLFYHLKLRCYVAIDLKMGKFKPADAGQMNFYLSALDDSMKSPIDNPSIGIILCKDKKNVVVEYALRDLNKPIGVASYLLADALPDNLKSSIPTVEDFEQRLKEVDEGNS
jgi:predicted nuclease of restriction endonuclease-like (RecB) superfamily